MDRALKLKQIALIPNKIVLTNLFYQSIMLTDTSRQDWSEFRSKFESQYEKSYTQIKNTWLNYEVVILEELTNTEVSRFLILSCIYFFYFFFSFFFIM